MNLSETMIQALRNISDECAFTTNHPDYFGGWTSYSLTAVRPNTMRALVRRGLVEQLGENPEHSWCRLTDAGKRVLQDRPETARV